MKIKKITSWFRIRRKTRVSRWYYVSELPLAKQNIGVSAIADEKHEWHERREVATGFDQSIFVRMMN